MPRGQACLDWLDGGQCSNLLYCYFAKESKQTYLSGRITHGGRDSVHAVRGTLTHYVPYLPVKPPYRTYCTVQQLGLYIFIYNKNIYLVYKLSMCHFEACSELVDFHHF